MDFHTATAADLMELGWVRWNDETDLHLCPLAQLPDLPDGIALHSISGAVAVKGRDYIDDDTRGGFIAYGIIPGQTTTEITATEVQAATALRSAATEGDPMPTDLEIVQDICARHGYNLAPQDPKDREIAELRERLAAAEQAHREVSATLRRVVREQEQDDIVHRQRQNSMMEAVPNRRFPGGTRLDEMVVETCKWLRELRPELWTRP